MVRHGKPYVLGFVTLLKTGINVLRRVLFLPSTKLGEQISAQVNSAAIPDRYGNYIFVYSDLKYTTPHFFHISNEQLSYSQYKFSDRGHTLKALKTV